MNNELPRFELPSFLTIQKGKRQVKTEIHNGTTAIEFLITSINGEPFIDKELEKATTLSGNKVKFNRELYKIALAEFLTSGQPPRNGKYILVLPPYKNNIPKPNTKKAYTRVYPKVTVVESGAYITTYTQTKRGDGTSIVCKLKPGCVASGFGSDPDYQYDLELAEWEVERPGMVN